MEDQRSIVIIGGGLSGLALGSFIKDGGFNCIILEKESQPGGVIQTAQKNDFILEYGANTTTTNLAVEELVSILGLEDELIEPSENVKKRYILHKNKLKAVSPKPNDILFSSLLSMGAKWSIFTEPNKKKRESYDDETVGAFFERRFDREIVDKLVNPMIAGIYGGDPYQLSMQSVFPKLIEFENEHGSVIKGLKNSKEGLGRRKIISFKNGMGTLTNAMADYIGRENILCGMQAKQVTPLENGQFSIIITENEQQLEIVADVVVFATPSYVTAEFVRPISEDLANLMQLQYPKMAVVHLGYEASEVTKTIDGFGFLVPEQEHKALLGAMANTSFLPNRSPEGTKLFTLFVGGMRQQNNLHSNPEQFIQQAVIDFEEIMGIAAQPVLKEHTILENAIPQFGLGHQQMIEGFNFFETNLQNIHILGNYRSGIAVSDCIQGAKRAHGKLIKDYSRQSYMANRDTQL